jgi:hypothetical protein
MLNLIKKASYNQVSKTKTENDARFDIVDSWKTEENINEKINAYEANIADWRF